MPIIRTWLARKTIFIYHGAGGMPIDARNGQHDETKTCTHNGDRHVDAFWFHIYVSIYMKPQD